MYFALLASLLCLLSVETVQSEGVSQVLPIFSRVPERTIYVNPNARTQFTCSAWPPNAKLSIGTFHRTFQSLYPEYAQMMTYGFTKESNIALLNGDFGDEAKNSSSIIRAGSVNENNLMFSSNYLGQALKKFSNSFSNQMTIGGGGENVLSHSINLQFKVDGGYPQTLQQLHAKDLSCMAETSLGRVLSPPFNLQIASMGSLPLPGVKPEPLQFFSGNTGFVQCPIPTHSYPTPQVSFLKNGNALDLKQVEGKYHLVYSTDGSMATLFLNKVDNDDNGNYTCIYRNPISNQQLVSPTPFELTVKFSQQTLRASVRKTMFPDPNVKVIRVHEGQNVSLWCVLSQVPPPTAFYLARHGGNRDNSRLISRYPFPILDIINVHPSDEGSYICNTQRLNEAIELKVIPKLRIVHAPQDVILTQEGQNFKFECRTSDPNITPIWLHNGVTILGHSANTSLLTDNFNSRAQLGVYQCLAMSTDPDGRHNQWVSASAVLMMHDVDVITSPMQLAALLPPNLPVTKQAQPQMTLAMFTPNVTTIRDNLAALIRWNASDYDIIGLLPRQQPEFQKFHQAVRQNMPYPMRFVLQISRQKDNGTIPDALDGLISGQQLDWTDPIDYEVSVKQKDSAGAYHVYLGETDLKPGGKYRFRVVIRDTETELPILLPSDWSEVLSFAHISPVQPPEIQTVKALPNGAIHVIWSYTGDGSKRFEAETIDPMQAQTGDESPETYFTADAFRIMARSVRKTPSDVIEYGKYKAVDVPGAGTRSGTIMGLDKSSSYQVAVYAMRGQADSRVVTRFSKPHYAGTVSLTSDQSFLASAMDTVLNHKMLYLIVVASAGLLILFISMVILIVGHQRTKARRARNARGPGKGGYPYLYNDVAKSPPPPVAQHNNHHASQMNMVTPMMSMSPEQHAQMQADQYAASIAQVRSMMVAQQQHQQQPMHHQSQQSLLMSSAPPMSPQHHQQQQQQQQQQMMMNGNIYGKPPFYSGTLPNGSSAAGTVAGRFARPTLAGSQMLYSPDQLSQDFSPQQQYMASPQSQPQGAYLGGPMSSSTLQRPGSHMMMTSPIHYHPLSFTNEGSTPSAYKGSQQNLMYQQQQQQQQQVPQMLYGSHQQMMQLSHQHHDGESVYSYFSQHDLSGLPQTPGSMHPQLNPLLEEGANGYGPENTLNNSMTGSPAQGGQRHHRRRKRKQGGSIGPAGGAQYGELGILQQQQQQQQQEMIMMQQMNGGYPPPPLSLLNGVGSQTNLMHQQQQHQQQHLDEQQRSRAGFPVGTNDTGMPLPPPNQPPPPPPSFGGQAINGAGKFPYPPKMRDYSEYGIPSSTGN